MLPDRQSITGSDLIPDYILEFSRGIFLSPERAYHTGPRTRNTKKITGGIYSIF